MTFKKNEYSYEQCGKWRDDTPRSYEQYDERHDDTPRSYEQYGGRHDDTPRSCKQCGERHDGTPRSHGDEDNDSHEKCGEWRDTRSHEGTTVAVISHIEAETERELDQWGWCNRQWVSAQDAEYIR